MGACGRRNSRPWRRRLTGPGPRPPRLHLARRRVDPVSRHVDRVALRARSKPGTEGLPPEATSRAVDEHLAVLDDAAFGGATPVTPKFISPADPAGRWTGAHGGLAYFGYATNYLIDLDHAVIVDVRSLAGAAGGRESLLAAAAKTSGTRQADPGAHARPGLRPRAKLTRWPGAAEPGPAFSTKSARSRHLTPPERG